MKRIYISDTAHQVLKVLAATKQITMQELLEQIVSNLSVDKEFKVSDLNHHFSETEKEKS